ncbi:MAG: murein biosynthesis integral membrane protein MurJ [Clostridia bacterium]|nr:murein biosynthesis integral membrane protein MurJ [Clostridia bacterium]
MSQAQGKTSVAKGVAQAAGILMVAMFLSRILGFVREQAITTKFGTSADTDAYIAAFAVPDLLYNLLIGGALSAAFIPVFSGYLARGQEDDAWEAASTVANLLFIVMTVVVVLGIIFAPYLVPLVAYKFQGETLELTVLLTRIMLPAILFHGLNGLMMGILNSKNHFVASAIGGVMYNVGIIFSGLLLANQYGIIGFSIGVLVGVVINFLVQFPTLIRKGLKYRFSLNLKHPGVRRMGILMIPAVIGLSANQINLIVNQNFASALDEGSITALRMANRLMLLPLGLFGFTIGAAVFPTLAGQVATNQAAEFRKTFSGALRSVLFITVPAAAGLMALSVPIVRLLFQQGEFSPQATMVTADALFYYCIGLFAQAAVLVLVRAYYALQDTVTPVVIGVLTILLNYFMNLWLVEPMEASGLALAYSVTGLFNMVSLLLLLRRKIKAIDGRKIITSLVQVLAAALIMGFMAYGVSTVAEPYLNLTSKTHQLVQVALAVTVGVAAYAGLTLLFRMEEARQVIDVVKRKLQRA